MQKNYLKYQMQKKVLYFPLAGGGREIFIDTTAEYLVGCFFHIDNNVGNIYRLRRRDVRVAIQLYIILYIKEINFFNNV